MSHRSQRGIAANQEERWCWRRERRRHKEYNDAAGAKISVEQRPKKCLGDGRRAVRDRLGRREKKRIEPAMSARERTGRRTSPTPAPCSERPPGTRARRRASEAGEVEPERPAQPLRPELLQVLRVFQEQITEEERHHADGEIDVEDPPPGVVVGDPAAEGRPEDRRISTPTPNIVIAEPCFSSGKLSSSTPWVLGCRPPPASPWRSRKKMSCGRLVAMPHRPEAEGEDRPTEARK